MRLYFGLFLVAALLLAPLLSPDPATDPTPGVESRQADRAASRGSLDATLTLLNDEDQNGEDSEVPTP